MPEEADGVDIRKITPVQVLSAGCSFYSYSTIHHISIIPILQGIHRNTSDDNAGYVGYNITEGGGIVFEDDFPARLTQLRMKKGASARDMSLSIGQNAGYIHNIESGKALPSMSVFFFICEYLSITPSEFFEMDSNNPSKVDSIVKDLKRLNDIQLDTIATLVKDLARNA